VTYFLRVRDSVLHCVLLAQRISPLELHNPRTHFCSARVQELRNKHSADFLCRHPSSALVCSHIHTREANEIRSRMHPPFTLLREAFLRVKQNGFYVARVHFLRFYEVVLRFMSFVCVPILCTVYAQTIRKSISKVQ
jgi:hypothetical protein